LLRKRSRGKSTLRKVRTAIEELTAFIASLNKLTFFAVRAGYISGYAFSVFTFREVLTT
jgi:hypothetical protein